MGAWRKLAASGVLISFLAAAAVGSAGDSAPKVVEARMVLATDAARTGSTVDAAVVAQVAPGYHINDHKPTLDYLIPTELKLEPSPSLSVEKIAYPTGEAVRFAFADEPLSVYQGTVLVGARLKVRAATPAGTHTLKGKFAYQACNDHACLPPTSVSVELTFKVVARGAVVKRVNADVFQKIKFE